MFGKYSPYNEYRDSQVEWLGKLPANWDVVPGKRLFSLECHPAPAGNNIELLSVYTDIGVRPRHTLEQKGNKASTTDGYWIVRKGDLVVNKLLAWMGAIGYSDYDGVTSPAYDILRKIRPLEPKYYHYLFRLENTGLEFKRWSRGIMDMRLRLYFEEFGKIFLPFPPLKEQTQIAKFLDYETAKIDALIAKQQQLIALLQEKRQAVISHAVTKGLNPAAPLRDSGVEWLGKVPAHWEEYPLKALFGLKHGYAFDSTKFSDSGKFILMTPGNFNERGGFRHKIPEKFYTGTDIPKDFILKSGQLLVAMTEQGPGLLGCALFVPEQGTYLHNQRLGLVQKICSDKVSVQYLFHLFNSSRYRAEVSVSSTGAKVQHTSPAKILSIKIWLPPLSEQELIARFVDDRIAKVDILEVKAEQTIELLQERRTALISAAVTGKIDVRGWQPPANAEGATP